MGLLSDPVITDDASVQRNFEALARRIYTGRGSPEGVVAGRVGALYLREDGGAGTTLYVKETSPTDKTGWVAK